MRYNKELQWLIVDYLVFVYKYITKQLDQIACKTNIGCDYPTNFEEMAQ